MGLYETILLGLALAMDSFAVSLAASVNPRSHTPRVAVSMVLQFALFQGGMTLLGWFAGLRIATVIASIDHWVAFGLLLFLGLRMIREGMRPSEARSFDLDRWIAISTLGVATSIDAFAVGLSLAFAEMPAYGPSAVIAVVTAVMTAIGVLAGRALGRRFGDRMLLGGGAILIFLGARILWEHTLA